jgi:tRNA threonylcarbamoyladenosine biosynthesis protein TsaB
MPRFIDGPVLGLETSGGLTGAALVHHGRLVGETALDHRLGSSELLAGMIAGLLQQLSLRPSGLARIGISLGPGSFTGLRVGLAAGRALAWGAGVPVVGVPSHEALAWTCREVEGPIALLTGLRRGLVYVEAGSWEGDAWRILLPARNAPVADLQALLLAAAGGRRLHFLGESVESVCLTEPGVAALGRESGGDPAGARRPAPVAFLAARAEAAELRGEALTGLEPLYLREADARRPGTAGPSRV